jgi:hypothetical protein
MAFILDVGSNGVWKLWEWNVGCATGLHPICLQPNWRFVFAQLKFGNTSTFQIGKGTPGARRVLGFRCPMRTCMLVCHGTKQSQEFFCKNFWSTGRPQSAESDPHEPSAAFNRLM